MKPNANPNPKILVVETKWKQRADRPDKLITSAVDWWRTINPYKRLGEKTGWLVNVVKMPVEWGRPPAELEEQWRQLGAVYDLCVMSYMDNPVAYAWLKAWSAMFNIPIVMDCDDDLFTVDEMNPIKPELEADVVPGVRRHDSLRKILSDVDYLTVSTPALVDVYGQIRPFRPIPIEMPNMIDPLVWNHPRAKETYPINKRPVRFVWWGGITHYKDLVNVLLPAWLEVVKKHPKVTLTTIGMPMDDLNDVPGIEQREGAGNFYKWIELWKTFDYDAAVMPLADIPFNESKSNIKWQEAAMAKLPVVASNVGPYGRSIFSSKTGFLAKDTAQWVRFLNDLIEQPNLRRKIAEQAYKEVLAKWTVDRIVPKYQAFVKGVLSSDRPWLDQGPTESLPTGILNTAPPRGD